MSSFYNVDGQFAIEADWPSEFPQFDCFLEETTKNTLINLTIVTDLVLDLVTEPVRFTKIFSVRFARPDLSSTFNTLFSSIRGTVSRESYTLTLTPSEKEKTKFDVVSCEVLTRTRVGTGLERSKSVTEENDEDALRESMNQEPLMSGSGKVSCTMDVVYRSYRVEIELLA